MSQPEHDGGDGEHRQVVDGPFLIAGRDPTELLQAVDQPLHDIPLPIRILVKPDPSLPFLPRNHHPNPSTAQIPPDLLAAVALVPSDPIRSNPRSSSAPLDRSSLHQGLEHDLLVALSGGQQQDHGLALPLGSDVDLGAEATLTPSQRL